MELLGFGSGAGLEFPTLYYGLYSYLLNTFIGLEFEWLAFSHSSVQHQINNAADFRPSQ